jgi:hypothetical protein
LKIQCDRKFFFDREEEIACARSSREKNTTRRENLRSLTVASRADLRDREIGSKIRVHCARSLAQEISFSFRAYSDEIFCALVLFTK